jgi:thiosulfate dehydrogenase
MKRAIVVAAMLALAGCAGGAVRSAAVYDPRALPGGPVGISIAYGRALIARTPYWMPNYVRADLSCADCHIAAGTQPRGGSFLGTYARFPQWNRRARRVIALQDRIAECFLYSMNGRAPAYDSPQMIAIVAYIAWVSRGTPIGSSQPRSDRYLEALPPSRPSPGRGALLYFDRCARCHQSDGRGISGLFPPLWGRRSFNDGAGMAHIDRMTGFIRYNMPRDAPGSLSLAQAYDVAAFVLSHERPHFRRNVLVLSPPRPAKYF